MAKWSVFGRVPVLETGCNNFSAIAGYISNATNHLWAVKVNNVNNNETKATLIYYDNADNIDTIYVNYESGQSFQGSYCVAHNSLGHAQGMGCSSSYLWIGCANSSHTQHYVLRIPVATAASLTGNKYYSDLSSYSVSIPSDFTHGIGALTFHSSNTLLARDTRWSSVEKIKEKEHDRLVFLGYHGGSAPYLTVNSTFYIHIPGSYCSSIIHSQNIFYDRVNGYLYAIFNLANNDNRISVYNISGSPSGTYSDGLPYYNAIKTITIKPSGRIDTSVIYDKIEIESAALDKDGKLLMAGNFTVSSGSTGNDRIIKLPNYNPANPTA